MVSKQNHRKASQTAIILQLNKVISNLIIVGFFICMTTAVPLTHKENDIVEQQWPEPNPNIGVFPHESSCQYYYLVLSEDIYVKKCPEGELYDYIDHRCSGKETARCWSHHLGKMKHLFSTTADPNAMSRPEPMDKLYHYLFSGYRLSDDKRNKINIQMKLKSETTERTIFTASTKDIPGSIAANNTKENNTTQSSISIDQNGLQKLTIICYVIAVIVILIFIKNFTPNWKPICTTILKYLSDIIPERKEYVHYVNNYVERKEGEADDNPYRRLNCSPINGSSKMVNK